MSDLCVIKYFLRLAVGWTIYVFSPFQENMGSGVRMKVAIVHLLCTTYNYMFVEPMIKHPGCPFGRMRNEHLTQNQSLDPTVLNACNNCDLHPFRYLNDLALLRYWSRKAKTPTRPTAQNSKAAAANREANRYCRTAVFHAMLQGGQFSANNFFIIALLFFFVLEWVALLFVQGGGGATG